MAYTPEQTKYLKKLIDDSARAAKKVDKAREAYEKAEAEHDAISAKITDAVAGIKLGTFVLPSEQDDIEGDHLTVSNDTTPEEEGVFEEE